MDQPAQHGTGTDRQTVRMPVPFVSGPAGTELVEGELVFDPVDPYAISMHLAARSGSVVWTFARELLVEGVHEPAGDGDVHVWPCLGVAGEAVVVIELLSPDGRAMLQATSRLVMAFLSRTLELVPAGEETDHLSLDGVIDRLLAG